MTSDIVTQAAAVLLISIAPTAILIRMISRGSCVFMHQNKKYVACNLQNSWAAGVYVTRCRCAFSSHLYKARWVCEPCGKMGEHCVKGWGDWTVEHGKLVPDVKKLANWSESR